MLAAFTDWLELTGWLSLLAGWLELDGLSSGLNYYQPGQLTSGQSIGLSAVYRPGQLTSGVPMVYRSIGLSAVYRPCRCGADVITNPVSFSTGADKKQRIIKKTLAVKSLIYSTLLL